MTGRFDTYIYTDGRGGFQAVSPEANRAAMPIVQRSLLYEPPPQWIREHRPVRDYPPSLAHVADGLYATAAGRYQGRDGPLTHAIAATDRRAYGLVRPAQLCGAPFWSTGPAPTRQCPALAAGWRPGPFGVPEAQRFIRGHDRGVQLLTALLSELRRAGRDRRRVLFVARDPELVLRWVTAATVLMPQREALEIGFKVFTLDPRYAGQRVLAVHPEWSTGAAGLENQLGYAVFDLIRNDCSPVVPDPVCGRWVELFVNEDPYDVTAAVEVAAESGIGGPAGAAFGVSVVLRRPPQPGAIRPIVEWLGTGPEPLVRRYGVEVVDQLLATAHRWPVDELVKLDAVVARTVIPRAAVIRLSLIAAEILQLHRSPVVRPGHPPVIAPAGWGGDAEAAAVEQVAEAMRAAAPELFEGLLRLAARVRLRPPAATSEPGLRHFVEHWAAHPEVFYLSEEWAGGDEVEGALRTLLGGRLAADPALADPLGDDWWETLLTTPVQLRTALDDVLVSAAVVGMADEERPGFVEQMLLGARTAARPDEAFRHVTAVLWRRTPPTAAEARHLCHLLPEQVTFGRDAFPALATALLAEPVTDADFEAAYALTQERPAWQPSPAVRARLRHERDIRYVLLHVVKASADPVPIAEVLARVPEHTRHSHRERLLDAMLKAPEAAKVLALLTAAPELREPFAARLSEPRQPAHVAVAFVIGDRGPVEAFLRHASDARLHPVTEQLSRLDAPWPQQWAAALRAVRGRGPVGRFLRRGGHL